MFELRPFQKEALEILATPGPGCHLVCVAPTGAGKSLIYERLAASGKFRMLLITPLVALARQQAARLRALGVAVSLGAGEPRDPPPAGRGPGAWIISPESLHRLRGSGQLRRWSANFLVVDECHCLWEWGEDFRPAFKLLPPLLAELGISRSLWLTATLPPQARQELRATLPPLREIGRFALPSALSLEVLRTPWPERSETLLRLFAEARLSGPGIVFVATREATARVARLLSAFGLSALPYHAGLSSEERRAAERIISRGGCDVVVATSAFGMGMDHAHLRWVVLWQAPPSLLSLAQAIGRAGRDLKREARAVVLWHEEDFKVLEWAIARSPRRRADLQETWEFLHSSACRSVYLSRYFEGTKPGQDVPARGCGRCDACGVRPDFRDFPRK